MPGQNQWWGWGGSAVLPPALEHQVMQALGELARPSPGVALADALLPPSRLTRATKRKLGAVVDLRDDDRARALTAAGRSYPDLIRLRAGVIDPAPDAVARPRTSDEVAVLLRVCSEESVGVVPFGGGTSVVGGVEPLDGGLGAVLALDLSMLAGVTDVNERDMTATIAGGTRLADADAALAARGLTLGHFPQSFERATVGGGVATRSSGQSSGGTDASPTRSSA